MLLLCRPCVCSRCRNSWTTDVELVEWGDWGSSVAMRVSCSGGVSVERAEERIVSPCLGGIGWRWERRFRERIESGRGRAHTTHCIFVGWPSLSSLSLTLSLSFAATCDDAAAWAWLPVAVPSATCSRYYCPTTADGCRGFVLCSVRSNPKIY